MSLCLILTYILTSSVSASQCTQTHQPHLQLYSPSIKSSILFSNPPVVDACVATLIYPVSSLTSPLLLHLLFLSCLPTVPDFMHPCTYPIENQFCLLPLSPPAVLVSTFRNIPTGKATTFSSNSSTLFSFSPSFVVIC